MRSSRVLILTAALVLGAAVTIVPAQLAAAQSPSTAVLVPSDRATVGGTAVVLDASASSGVTQVQFELTGGSLTDQIIATAKITQDGWIASWNSNIAANGIYTLQSVATEGTSSATSPGISITVDNPTLSFLVPPSPPSGSFVSGSVWLDIAASPGVTSVKLGAFSAQGGCPPPVVAPGQVTSCFFGYATPTQYGWLFKWDTTNMPNGDYALLASGSNAYGSGSTGLYSYGLTVNNPGPTVVVPANNSTVSGSQWLDCSTPSNLGETAGVEFWLTGGTLTSPQLLGTATQTYDGWLFDWNSASVANGTYSLYCTAAYPDGARSDRSPHQAVISVSVAN